jgi:catechol 2,3-dioxygenase-like lactoylglutathione lyase family enzyme
MIFTHTCIITDDVKVLSLFYEEVLGIKAVYYGKDYSEFNTERGTLSIYRADMFNELAPNSAFPAYNRSVILEFSVEDVDAEYERLQEVAVEWVKPPTTQPWGNRSIYFRDLDGNLVNFYMQVNS